MHYIYLIAYQKLIHRETRNDNPNVTISQKMTAMMHKRIMYAGKLIGISRKADIGTIEDASTPRKEK